jgi:hypothetical protein
MSVCRVIYSYTAVSSTSQALSAADMDTGAIQSALGTMGLIRVVVLALAIVAMVVVLLLSVGHMFSKRQSRGRGEHAGGKRKASHKHQGLLGSAGLLCEVTTCSKYVGHHVQELLMRTRADCAAVSAAAAAAAQVSAAAAARAAAVL